MELSINKGIEGAPAHARDAVRNSAAGSLPFYPKAAAVGILDRVRREWRAVATVGVTGRIRIIGVRAELAAVVPLLVIQARRGASIANGFVAD
jgi:hypothetical protein